LEGILVRAPAPPCGNTIARAANNTSEERPTIRYQPIETERRLPHAQCRSAEYSRAALAYAPNNKAPNVTVKHRACQD
jgi:hypothetical protein